MMMTMQTANQCFIVVCFVQEADTPKKEKVLKNNLSEADRLDNAMCIVYTYIDKTCKNKGS